MTKNTQVSIEDVGPLIAWLTEQAIQAANADQSRDAGMLTWAAQVIGECVDDDAPDPPAVGEVGDEARRLAKELRDQADDMIREQLQDYVVPHNRPDTSLRAELKAELASQQEVVSSLRERVERLERRWAKETAGGDKLDRQADGPAVPDGREPASVVGEPSDEELLGLDQLEEAWNAQADAANGWNELGLDEIIVWAQRQALARWGHQPAPPVEGEVGELVALIRQTALAWEPDACLLGNMTAGQLSRTAELLQQRHPEPVPVSERLPGAEDCDEDGRCWLFSKVRDEWRLVDVVNPGVPRLKYCFSHWLPANALPLPQQETPND